MRNSSAAQNIPLTSPVLRERRSVVPIVTENNEDQIEITDEENTLKFSIDELTYKTIKNQIDVINLQPKITNEELTEKLLIYLKANVGSLPDILSEVFQKDVTEEDKALQKKYVLSIIKQILNSQAPPSSNSEMIIPPSVQESSNKKYSSSLEQQLDYMSMVGGKSRRKYIHRRNTTRKK